MISATVLLCSDHINQKWLLVDLNTCHSLIMDFYDIYITNNMAGKSPSLLTSRLDVILKARPARWPAAPVYLLTYNLHKGVSANFFQATQFS